MIAAFAKIVDVRGLLAPHDRILAAVSGGGDSIALLRLLVAHAREIPLTILVAHVNHRVRGLASDADQRFVEQLSQVFGLRCLSFAVDRNQRAGTDSPRSEEQLRQCRHGFLEKAAREAGCRKIALGHTLDDQAETVLMRMLRGAGRRGLSGMAFAGPGRLIRPLLGVRRAELRRYLREIDQDFREDESNADPRYLRNRIRADLMPHLRQFNPSIATTLGRSAEVLAEEDRYLDRLAREHVEPRIQFWPGEEADPAQSLVGLSVPSKVIENLPPALARRAVRVLLDKMSDDPRAASSSSVEAVLDLARRHRGEGSRSLVRGIRAYRSGEDIFLRHGSRPSGRTGESCQAILPIPGAAVLEGRGQTIEARVVAPSGVEGLSPGPERAWMDADRLGRLVTIRTRLAGDRFHPLGAPGGRKLKEFLIDEKVPCSERDSIPLVIGPEGIAWVVGSRIGEPYRLTENTRRVVVLELRLSVDSTDL